MNIPFERFWCFTDIGSWRQHCRNYDLYIGDRIHGGVVALQAGIPAIILFDDDRVKELCNYHGIPCCSLDTFSKLKISATIDKLMTKNQIEQMKSRLHVCFNKFKKHCSKEGLLLDD